MSKAVIQDFTQGELFRPMLKFSIPFMLSNAFQVFYSMTDMIIVGQFVGKQGIAAVMSGGFLVMFIMMIGLGLATGGQVLVSQLIGKNERHRLNSAIGTLISMNLAAAGIMAAAAVILAPTVLRWMNTQAEAFASTQDYLVICGGGVVFIYVYNALSAILRGVGDSVRPFVFIVASAAVNILLDLLMVALWDWGVAGAAVATVISQAAAMFMAIYYMYIKRKEFELSFSLGTLRWQRDVLWALLKLGIPFSVRFAAINVSMIFVVSLINSLGVAAAAAFGIALRLDELANKISQGVMMAVSTIVGQNIGAGRIDRIRKGVYYAWSICGGFFLFFGLLLFFFPDKMFALFTDDESVLELAPLIVSALLLHYPALLIMKGTNGFVQGIGNALFGLIIALLDGVVCRIFFSWFFGVALNMGLYGMVLGYSLATYSTALPNLFYFLFVPWYKRKTVI
ncbi:MAG: MATE family efflux transporter [Lentisphaerae bacterium]|nr:MATE family efflux transporter [Lentisphaerota bacterium]